MTKQRPIINITIAGSARTGKSTIAYQIQRLLEGYGLDVEHPEPELNALGIDRRLNDPLDLLKDIKDKNPLIVIVEKNLLPNCCFDTP